MVPDQTMRHKGYRFPPDFLWGAVTSSHQVEGNRARVGLAAVDCDTQHREPRPCAEWFGNACRTNTVCTDEYATASESELYGAKSRVVDSHPGRHRSRT